MTAVMENPAVHVPVAGLLRVRPCGQCERKSSEAEYIEGSRHLNPFIVPPRAWYFLRRLPSGSDLVIEYGLREEESSKKGRRIEEEKQCQDAKSDIKSNRTHSKSLSDTQQSRSIDVETLKGETR